MPHPHVRLFETPDSPPPFRYDGEPEGLTPRDPEAIAADIDAAVKSGASWIVLGAHEPGAYPDLQRVLYAVDDHGARTKVTTNGRHFAERGVLERLRDASLAQIVIVFWGGTAATHDARVGHPGAFDTALETLRVASTLNSLMVTVRFVLMRDNVNELGPFVESIRQMANRCELVRLSALTKDLDVLRSQGVKRKDAVLAAQAAWEAARVVHLKLTTVGFGTYPHLPAARDVDVQPADGTLLDMLRNHVPVPAATNGTWATPEAGDVSGIWYAVENARTLQDLGLQLAAYGCPPLDLPPSMGGLGLDHRPADADAVAKGEVIPPRKRDGVSVLLRNVLDEIDTRPLPAWTGVGRAAKVAVISGYVTDNILVLSTLPGLVEALKARGADATLHSVWHAPFNPYDNELDLGQQTLTPSQDPERPGMRYPAGMVEGLSNTPARIAHARRQVAGFLAGLDLSGCDLVVVPGFDNALALIDNATLSNDARIVVADFHMLSGVGAWHERWLEGRRAMDGNWWPDERIQVHTLYPRYVRAYWRAGVPMRQVRWIPYPVHDDHFPPGPPAASCDTIFAGGTHQRDFTTLASATRLLGQLDPRRVVVHTTCAVPPPLRNQGEIRLLEFYEAIANSRFVVLPLEPDNRRPAGISVVSLALAAGRPVIATATHATVDHLRHGHNAILVPPKRPKALARAIARLLEDDDLVTKLSAGARSSAAHLSVSAWADLLLDGAPEKSVWTVGDSDVGPFFSWPA